MKLFLLLQVCDGVVDCPEGEDEDGDLCSSWRCEGDSVRCQEDNVCISPPSASLCSGLNSYYVFCLCYTETLFKVFEKIYFEF